MKGWTAGFKTARGQNARTMAKFWKISRTDGTVHGFTSLDSTITYATVPYVGLGGFSPAAWESATGLGVDNTELDAVIESAGITDADIYAGRFDFATFEFFELDYTNTGLGRNIIGAGFLGELSNDVLSARIELRSLAQILHQPRGGVMSEQCDAKLGDSRCGVALGPHTTTGTITAITDRQTFTVSNPPAASGGLFSSTSGDNDLINIEIADISGSVIQTILPFPFDFIIGDTYSAYRGCDFTFTTCRDVFSNGPAFRGFPYLVGNNAVLKTPDR